MPYEVIEDAAPAPVAAPRYEVIDAGEKPSVMDAVSRTLKMLTPAGQLSALLDPEGRTFLGNGLAGAVRGAGSIGATLTDGARSTGDAVLRTVPATMRPDVTAGLATAPRGAKLRADMDAGLQSLGADPSSLAYKAGKLSTEVGGTMGVGGAVAAPFKAAASPVLRTIGTALETGGFRTPGLTGPAALAVRSGTGAVTGGTSAGLVDPDSAGAGAILGGFLPPAAQVAGKAGQAVSNGIRSGAEWLMQTALKPTLAQLKSGDAATAIRTMLDNGINATKGGYDKLEGMVESTNDQIKQAIAGANAQVPKQAVATRLNDTRSTFMRQPSPLPDLAIIDGIENGFLTHPNYPGQSMSVQAAQDLKQGTYQLLKKKYGQMGTADTEAQKAIARGLKEEIAAAVPEVAPLNAKESALLATRDVLQRRALMESNKNPLGLAALAGSPHGFAAFMADKSALLKSLGARSMNSVAPVGGLLGVADNPALLPYVRAGLLSTEANP